MAALMPAFYFLEAPVINLGTTRFSQRLSSYPITILNNGVNFSVQFYVRVQYNARQPAELRSADSLPADSPVPCRASAPLSQALPSRQPSCYRCLFPVPGPLSVYDEKFFSGSCICVERTRKSKQSNGVK